jgi:regulator of sirC expression with transglutaminase-like and TPR domain
MRDELWTDTDDENLSRLRVAVASDELADALLAIEGAEWQHWDGARQRLARWGDCAAELVERSPELSDAEALVRVLAEEADFTGDTVDYGHPRNSHLTQVIARRRGLPIVLAGIYIIAGRRADFDVSGVGMPGHYLVRVGDTYLDPFDAGAQRSETECRALVQEITAGAFAWRPELLADTPTAPTIERVLRNLVHAHQQRRERELVYRSVRFLAAITPTRPETQLLHARLAEEFGAHKLALDLYESVMESFPDGPEARLAASRLGPLHTRARMLN